MAYGRHFIGDKAGDAVVSLDRAVVANHIVYEALKVDQRERRKLFGASPVEDAAIKEQEEVNRLLDEARNVQNRVVTILLQSETNGK